MKRNFLMVSLVLAVAGAWLLWPHDRTPVPPAPRSQSIATLAHPASAASTAATAIAAPKTVSTLNTNPLAYRLANTTKSVDQLLGAHHAILLQNALIDTDARLNLAIPAHLKAGGNPGAYIVQARGLVDAHFRSVLAAAGAEIVNHIPNNAYLVRVSAGGAARLLGNVLVQSVLPYEPYFKLQPSLLGLAVNASPLPPGTALNLGLFAGDATAEQQVTQLGAKIIGRDRSAFGPVLRVLAPADWTALARLPGVQVVEPARHRIMANDLSRVTLGISPDTISSSTYFGLSGSNVLVAVNDTGIDALHPDFALNRVLGLTPVDLTDTNGHGTHVAGIIGGNGSSSTNNLDVGSLAEGSVSGADFRGKAPLATLFSMNSGRSDYSLQTNAAMIGALISNNSWDNGNADYDLAAASYDGATRDAVPLAPGSQPVLFVFAAGNGGFGNNDGAGGSGDTIMSPGTAKNVITVGALEQLRNITNIVTTIADGVTNQSAHWQPWTDSSSQVAWFSSRGNVGIGTEGSYGRFKPDVVAPGTFVVSTSSQFNHEWDTNAYYNHGTNAQQTSYLDQVVSSNNLVYYNVSVPPNAISVNIAITPNRHSPTPFPNLPLYAQQSGPPDPVNAFGSIDIVSYQNSLAVPPGGGAVAFPGIAGNGFNFAVDCTNSGVVHYDLYVSVTLTNDVGDLYAVLEGMNDRLGGYYRYETGTSMAAAAVSGMLALIQDYFTNTLHQTPSPALLKAMLINGSRSVGGNALAFTNGVNLQGWGMPNIANSLPLTNLTAAIGTNSTLFFADQNPQTALATGDSHTYIVTLNTNSDAQYLNLQATLVWTDPPGDPSAAIKLVNNLDLIITNLDTGDVYVGNDIAVDVGYNQAWDTNNPPNLDSINNVENIILPPLLAGSYSVTVVGRDVNVNAITAHTNNVVQDYALVISCVGAETVPDAITVADGANGGISTNPTADQNITFVQSTNTPLYNQFAGASSPLLGTNGLPLGNNTVWGPNGLVTIGQINQWHFYVVTNTGTSADVTNAAFITFDSYTLSIPRMGVFADSAANATRPEADIDLYVSTDSSLTNLNPVAISNCLYGAANSGASLGQGGTEFVVYSNSSPGTVYYVGVKSEDRMASEYAFLPIFTSTPFSMLDQNGNQIVNGMLLPVPIPDGNNAHPGVTNIFALAIYPMVAQKVTVTNLDEHLNFGDLLGTLSFKGAYAVLNNHNGLGNTFGKPPRVYDDSRNRVFGTTNTAGPGSLLNFRGKSVLGPWILNEVDDSAGMSGRVSQLTLKIQPHRNLKRPGVIVTIPPGGWFIDYVDVPPGYTNLTFYATNLPPTISPPLQMYEKLGNDPTLTDYDQRADLTNGVPPGNTISIGPPLASGQYFIGIYNPSTSQTATVLLSDSLGIASSVNDVYNYSTTNGTQGLLDDAVTVDPGVFVAATNLIASVNIGLVVTTPRISDLTFTLVSPTGERALLMENRGSWDTNGAGGVFIYTNVITTSATGGRAPNTNYLAVPITGIQVPITYNFYTVPDEMTIYGGTNTANYYIGSPDFIYDTGFTNNVPSGPGAQNTVPVTMTITVPPGYTNITIIMNEFGNPYGAGGDAWTYTAGAAMTNYQYLEFTDNTNLATLPIKYAVPPYNFTQGASNFTLCNFESATNGNYQAPTNIPDAFGGWTVPTNLVTYSTVFDFTANQFVVVTNVQTMTNNWVSVVTDPVTSLGDNVGSNFLALANGTITRSIPTVPGRIYNVTFWYRGPGIAAWWRGEGNASDSSDPEKNGNNGTQVGPFSYPAGEVGQAFQMTDFGSQFEFAGTNAYVQIPQSASLDVGPAGGFTVEGWINPTNVLRPQPVVEWLAHVPTNTAVSNIVIQAGPYLDRDTGHYYYLLGATNWTTSEFWATQLGGHLVTVNTANEQNWVFDNFANYGGVNRNLWIGLTNGAAKFNWAGGQTNVAYTNWLAGQPLTTGGTRNYAFIRGSTNQPSGLWVAVNNNGVVQGSPTTNLVYGVVEVDQIQTNGVQLWVSATNSMPGGSNLLVNGYGALYANIVDTNFVSHEIYSAPLLLQSNVFQHIALTYNTNSGIAALYLNGTNVAVTNLGVFIPKTDGDVLLGHDLTLYTNNYFGGQMDEMSIYRRALSGAEIAAIYQVSAGSTNRLLGKFDPAVTPAYGLAEALVSFGSTTNVIFGINNQWEVNSFTFTATSNSMPLTISGLQPGILLDSFAVSEAPLTNLYYFPEQSLEAFTGNSAYGLWTLQIWDNRVGAYVTNANQLVNWQLSFVLDTNSLFAGSLSPQTPGSGTIPAGQTIYYSVTVPGWANVATNVLLSSTLPVDVFYFSPTNAPTGANPADWTLLTNVVSGVGAPILITNGVPPAQLLLLPGQTYYLGVRNPGSRSASISLEVDYDITGLTNGVPYAATLTTNDALRYFAFNVSSNAYEATFQLLKLSSNADLVVRKGVPLPWLTNADYGSFNVSNLDENIFVLTNSAPVPLSAGTWYLGVIRRSSGPVDYTVLAKELDSLPTTIIELTNGVPVNCTAGPGAAHTNFFHFAVTNMVVSGVTNLGLRFELFNLTGNGDLTVQTNAPPLSPPFFQLSQNPGLSSEMILLHTNSALTNLTADWYLGVPNNEATNISFTILAVFETNAYFPAFPGAGGAGGGAVGAGHAGVVSSVYHVTTTADSGPGSLRSAVGTNNRTVVFDIAGTITLASPLIITNSNLTIAGQSSPAGGITVAGDLTTVQSAHDVIIRDVRFRSGTPADSLQFTNTAAVVVDHVSASWSANNLVSVLNSTNITVQWSILADSLYATNTSFAGGSLLRSGGGIVSLNHNLYANNDIANPAVGDGVNLDFVNNVVYNWGFQPGSSITNNATNQLNYACNYLIAGPDTAQFATNLAITNIAFIGGTTNTWVYQTNNFIDSNTNRILDGGNTQWAMFTNQFSRLGRPLPFPPVPTDEAFIAYERVLDFAGVNLSQRDGVDATIVNEVRNQSGRLVSTPASFLGLVAWWKAENNAVDSIGTNNGSFINGAAFTNGMVGTAFNLNGSNYVSVPNAVALNPTNVITVECWLYRSALVGPFDPVIKKEDVSNANGYAIEFNANHLLFWVYRNVGGWASSGGSVPIALGQWYHIAGVYDGAHLLCYTNGQLASSAAVSGSVGISTNILSIGNDPGNPTRFFNGRLDEVSIYHRALSAAEIASIYNAGSAGKFAQTAAVQPYLDTDQDGIPDFWEITFATKPYVPSNNNDRDGDGYTDLEEYNNWLAAPHALTVTNTAVGVDLMQLCGQTGNLTFSVTNGVNGLVYLTNVLGNMTNTGLYSNSIAVFTPTNNSAGGTNFCGYAAFDLYVTNNDTIAYFGPVTVSVAVSAVTITTNPPPDVVSLTNGIPYHGSNVVAGTHYYSFNVDSNAVSVQFTVTNATGPVVLLASYGLPFPSLSSYDYMGSGSWDTSETIVLTTNSTPVPLTPGIWYLAVVNVSGTNVSYTIQANQWSSVTPPIFSYPTNTTVTNILETVPTAIPCVATDPNVPPLPLTYALLSPYPTGMTLTNNVLYWTPTEAQGPSTNEVKVSVSNGSFSVTNTFNVNVLESNLPPVFNRTNIPIQVAIASNLFVLANGATDPDLPVNTWGYNLFSDVMGLNLPVIDTNGVITWIPGLDQVGTNYQFTTIVTDTNLWAVNAQSLSATNTFTVMVLPPLPPGQPQTNVVGANSINWFGVVVPTNALFATNTLIFATLPVNVWFSTNVPPSVTNGWDTALLVYTNQGISVLNTNLATAPTNIIPGGRYFLGVQNPNSVPVTNAVQVDFALVTPPPVLPVIPVQVITVGDTLVVTNTATDTNAGAALVYVLTNAPVGAVISSNGIITWATTTNTTPTNVVFTTVVTDTNANQSALNSFTVVVLPNLVIDQPQTNVVNPGGIRWFTIKVPTNADFATNNLVFASSPVNFWFSTNLPPSIVNAGDVELLTNSVGGSTVFTTNTAPYLVPATRYYLGVQNTNAIPVTNAVKVSFHLVLSQPLFYLSSVTPANVGGTNGYLITWFAPASEQFHLQWTKVIQPSSWRSFNGVISYSAFLTAGSSRFTYFDDGSQTGGLDPTRFYRLRLLNSPTNTAPYFKNAAPSDQNVLARSPLSFTNTAGDWDVPAQSLTYSVSSTLAGTNAVVIDTNGVITWTPTLAQGGLTNIITTVVTDNGLPVKQATNRVAVVVNVLGFKPLAATSPAQLVSGTTARLGGFATPNGPPAIAWFEWGGNTQYGSNTPPVSVGTGYNAVWVTNSITALTSGVPYHFRLVVSNSVGVARGFDQVFSQGKVIGWGNNGNGQTTVPSILTNMVAVAAGSFHSLVLKSDGTVVAWGYNQFGQTNVPGGLNNVVALAAGDYHSLALQADGTVAVWGLNGYGLLNIPAGLNNVVAVAAGYYHNLALKSDGTVAAWGLDGNGQSDVPVGLNNVVAIAAGLYHSVALKSDGTIVVWGDNGSGQTNVPPGLSNVVAVAAGANQSLALKSDGTLVAWGDNFYGQTNVPVGLTNVVAVVGSSHDSAALKSDGTVVVWGANNLIQTFVPPTVRNAVGLASRGDFSLALVSANPVNPTNAVAPVTFSIGSLLSDTNGVSLQWAGTTNQQFQIRWTTNLLPPAVWTLFSNNLAPLTVTSTNGTFRFADTNVSLMKFYQLILLP